MSRPKMKDEKKRITISISVAPDVAELAEKTDNKSKFIDRSVHGMRATAMIIAQLRKREISLEAAMEEIEDYADIWEASFDEVVEYVPAHAALAIKGT